MSETQTPARQIVLADGLADFTIPVSTFPGGPMSALPFKAGKPLNVVADDSADPGVGATLAQSLVTRGLATYVGNVDNDETDESERVEATLPQPPVVPAATAPPSIASISTESAATAGGLKIASEQQAPQEQSVVENEAEQEHPIVVAESAPTHEDEPE